jgi:chromosome segregation ATPase
MWDFIWKFLEKLGLIDKAIELGKKYLKVSLVAISAALLIFLTWLILGHFQVNPLAQRIKELNEQVAKLEAVNEPNRKQIQELSTKNMKLENDLEASQNNLIKTQDTIKALEAHKSALENKVSRYEANSNIFSEIRKLEERKASLDKLLTRPRWGSSMVIAEGKEVKPEPYIPTYTETQWQHQSGELHGRILDLQRQLQCQPK